MFSQVTASGSRALRDLVRHLVREKFSQRVRKILRSW